MKLKAWLCSVLFSVVFAGAAFADTVYNVDVVVLGAGAGGTTAGLAAIEKGYKVLVLEKSPALGGSGNFMEGTFAVGSSMQVQESIGINPEKQFKMVMDFHHWRINGKVLNNWLKETGPGIEWMKARGINFEKVTTAFIDGNRTWHMFEGGHGSSLIKVFAEKIRQGGGTILTETPAKELIMKNGRAVGVIAEDPDGERVVVNAKKGVIVATGGFPCNEEMIAKYLPYSGYKFLGASYRDGDGIRMMESVGTRLINMSVVMQAGLWLKDVPSEQLFGASTKYVRLQGVVYQPYLKVDLQGNRVADETLPLEYLSNAFEEVGGEGYLVFDENTRKEVMEVGLINGFFGLIKRYEKINDFDTLFNDAIKDGFAFKANSLDALAKATGMDAATLKDTAATMNRMTEAKKDDEFYKDAEWLRSVNKGPYYAIKIGLRMYSTAGGAKVNEYFQPIKKDGKAIPGLYAIGQDAGGMYSDSYDMHIAEGTASSWAINGGRLAVDHISKQK